MDRNENTSNTNNNHRYLKSALINSELIVYGSGANVGIACMAFEALSLRDSKEDPTDMILKSLDSIRLWPCYFALKALPQNGKPLIGAVLSRVAEFWNENLFMQSMLKQFVSERLAGGEVPTFDNKLDSNSEYFIPELVS